ncbi:High affinity cGMP-specific 3',5'-cyclic phosphodiesterase 9A [Channa argus]|uniref:Phosphodiesterase n=1 Tax=Channa argus TaxID=215402 RepID=A0A6G1PYY2_CHAAH|nr:High affinity cGMP-specific 3',5'-cyclic phosphodiesterase 9A [Channa argus]
MSKQLRNLGVIYPSIIYLFRSAAEAGPHDILKLYNPKGNIINISPSLEPNSLNSSYKLEVVAADCNSAELAGALGFDLSSMEKRLQGLEKKILIEAGETPAVVYEMKKQVDSFREKLESVEHLSWLGLFKDLSEATHKPSPFYHKRTLRKTKEECEHACRGLTNQKKVFIKRLNEHITFEVGFVVRKSALHSPELGLRFICSKSFFSKPHNDGGGSNDMRFRTRYRMRTEAFQDFEICFPLLVMYTDLDFIVTFNIESDVLQRFLFEVYRRYNNIPFHNFKHCFCVTQMATKIHCTVNVAHSAALSFSVSMSEQMYGLIWLTDLRNKMDSTDLLIMLTSAVCHDLDHTGYNNAYQINARTELALRYNDISPLENHHCAVAFEILEKTESNIFRNLSMDQYKRIREGIIKCILATDMTRHNEILSKFKSILLTFDFTNKDHKEVNSCRGFRVPLISDALCISPQSDVEKLEGLPVTPFMDRDKVTKPSSQTGFIRFVLLPLFIELANLFPCLEVWGKLMNSLILQQHIIDPVRKALDYYTEMEKALEREKQNRAQSENGSKIKETATDAGFDALKPEAQ